MAEDKLTLASLRKALALQVGCTEDVAGTFLTHLFPVIVAGLKEDNQVRINGLGTFKLQWNEPRKSVNIRTGESIVIEGYNKVIFTPETSLKEQINEPFAHLEPVYLEGSSPEPTPAPFNPMHKFSEQAEEIKDLLSELGGFEDESTPTETPIETSSNKVPIEEEEQPIEEIVVENTEEVEEVSEDENKEQEEESTEETVVSKTPLTPNKTPNKDKRPFRPWRAVSITILIFCLLLVGAFFFLQHKIVAWADSLLAELPSTEIIVGESEQPTEIPTDTTDAVMTDINEEIEESAVSEEITEDTIRVYTEFITTEKLTNGSRLTWLSRKYYGAPDFWVYIYEANQDKLPNPNSIPVGTTIRIPKLPAEWIDTTNPQSMQQAKDLHNEILGIHE